MACETELGGNLMLAQENGLGEVSICTCGVLQLTLGAVTLRLAPEAFLQMLRMCEAAAHSPVLRRHAAVARTEAGPRTETRVH